MMRDYKVLFVDDEPELLRSFRRRFHRKINMDIAAGGREGLEAIDRYGPYAVVVSDYRMPAMDGIQFLTRVNKITPKTVRMMLTGEADLNTAIKAVNDGRVFRFLAKPCPPEALDQAIHEGIKYYQLVEAERRLNGLP